MASNNKPIEVMVLITNPDGFDSWAPKRQLARYRCVLEWHDLMAKMSPSKVPYIWGTHQILSQIRPSPTHDMLVAVYRVDSLSEFDELMYNDPLRSCSRYMTILLTDLRNDLEDDKKRLQRVRDELLISANAETRKELRKVQALFRSAPDFVGKQKSIKPLNLSVPYFADQSTDVAPERPLQILIYGQNPPEYMAWDDARKLAHYEKVLWWHDHVADMLSTNRMSHVWGNHDFCDISTLSYRSASGAAVYRVKDLDEFAEVYRLDPLRDSGRFLSVALKPIEAQRDLDLQRLRAREKQLDRRRN